jgi:hypothetical protein
MLYSDISQSYSSSGGYVMSRITQPLNTANTPSAMPYHFYSELAGGGNPPKFYPSDSSSHLAANHATFQRGISATPPPPTKWRQPQDSSSRLLALKAKAIGKSAIVATPTAPLGFHGAVDEEARYKRTIRNRGAVAIKKKGASLTPA